MKFTSAVATASLAAIAAAAPSKTITKRADSCGQWASIQTGNYVLYNNLWGQDNADSGQGCVGLDSLSGNSIAWHSIWTWKGGNAIKSYPNVVVNSAEDLTIGAISSMQSTWDWDYSGTNLNLDVAYDIFTSSTAGGSNEYEVMIWLSSMGAVGPISANYGADGSATPIATVDLAGYSWNVYSGSNGVNAVFSFLPVSGNDINSFSGDVYEFISYLIDNQGLPSSQYLISAGAGTEPTTGQDAVFTVTEYSMTIA
ncbi:hypothetical protein BTJ68_08170 [Hortaea werneckii EXF-2000]|uniref:Glycoside hydrolase family 12 protein n=2 Tax=Hortaea werneckii TaxID=91943 RepID=A0A3M7IZM7_HORWE|nr:hypothetical protein BTJ68_08170 [Hortaea werneckii EXF-2000]RMZ30786.1 hypothetical protein D0859_05117 [Hortaea werneckii]